MKSFALVLAVLALASCIPVDDLGNYWDNGVVDKALIGVWRPDAEFKAQSEEKDFVIAKSGDKYRMDSLNDKEKSEPGYKPTYAKTLKAGPYSFFMVGPRQGDLIRYKMSGDVIEVYSLNAKAAGALLKERYPDVKNIETHPENDRAYEDVQIKLLDDGVFKFLSEIPDTEAFWKVESRCTKVGG